MTDLISARWIFPVDTDPIENGTIEIQDGLITAVHSRSIPEARNLGNVAILPALINPHVHLEFSDLKEPISPSLPFTDWIRSVIRFRNQENRSIPEAIQKGSLESSQSGSALLGEIVTTDFLDESYSGTTAVESVSKILFREIIGLQPDQHHDCLSLATDFLEHSIFQTENHLSSGISPHAPYSVHWDLYEDLTSLAERKHVPLAIHLAETRSELELLTSQTGEFRKMLEDFGIWSESLFRKNQKPMDYLKQLEKVENALVIHGNYLDDDELNFLASHSNMTLVYCPRTHSYFQHDSHPWKEVINRGGRVALGTDGKSSNPDLELWKEVQFLSRLKHSYSANNLLKLVTLNPAIALGKENEWGSLSVGKKARFFFVKLPDSGSSEIDSLLFHQENEVFPEPGC